jgi:L-alanine-DL-glutamate epimerase-like enolase superfamily enzyme
MEVCVMGPYTHNQLNEPDSAVVEIVAACREAVGPDFVMMVDVCYCWTNAKQALRVLEQIEPYDIFFIGGIGIAATAHLSAVTAHCPHIEFLPASLSEAPLRRELVIEELQLTPGGLVPLPQRPGLGFELNWDAVKKYTVAHHA